MKKIFYLLLFFVVGIHGYMQDPIDSLKNVINTTKDEKIRVDTKILLSKQLETLDMSKAIANTREANQLAVKIDYTKGIAESNARLGLEYYFIGDYVNALINWESAKTDFIKIKDTARVANILSNMGAVYFNESQYTRALDLYLQSLKIAEMVHDTLRIGTVLQNIGAIHNEKGSYDLAIKAYEDALKLFIAIDYGDGIGLAYLNLGEAIRPNDELKSVSYFQKALPYLRPTLYFPTVLRTLGELQCSLNGFNEGFPYLDSAYNAALAANDQLELTRTINSMGRAYDEKGDKANAIKYYEKAKKVLLEGNYMNFELGLSTKALMRIYSETGDYKKAYENAKLVIMAKDSIFNFETKQKIDQMLFGYEIDKKNDSIQLLVKDKAIIVKDQQIQKIELEKQKNIRNGFIIGFLIVFAFSVLIFIQRNKIRKGKKLSDSLLLNILPEEVADELKLRGKTDAKSIDLVTVLFTDFKGFTSLSEQLSPQALVATINECFSEFDQIMQKHGVEKIKTIGDAYMAAGGLPTPNQTHPMDVVHAALEIRDFMMELSNKKRVKGEPFFEIRIGVHTGPVVAGIVGVKKFQYDIWGDTVNTASRMESSGEVGKVNISEATYNYVKENFKTEHRGAIHAKGKGDLHMYFVDKK